MAWFYRGARKLVAHWFDPGAAASLCERVDLEKGAVVWRHPKHDRHVPVCAHCQAKLDARKPLPSTV
jgi:hypothetical protein